MNDLNDVPLSGALTEREQAVLHLIAEGLSNRQIADELMLALDTVKWYIKRLYDKLGVSSRTQAIAKAETMGLLDKKAISNTQLHALPPAKLNLPAQTTRFIGREAELDDLTKLLSEPHVRLLTIVAPGGMGKTRLAIETAASQSANFAAGVYFVPLAPLTAIEQIVTAVADAVDFQFYGSGEPKQQLLNFFRAKSMLLVMDNFEHLLDGSEIISEILTAAPDVKILATSREALNLQEEFLYPLKGMRFPDQDPPENFENYSAIKLFAQHARRIRADFSLSQEQVGVTQICTLVEGMPLGIELAAAWIRALSCAEIANEIRSSLDILATSVRNVPERHRSMRAVLEQSWNRLPEGEQAVFKKLSVFRGGFSRQAAQAVAGASLPTLAALVDKSLLRHNADERYDIHELLRQYGNEKLNQSPEESEQIQDVHVAYYATFIHEREDDLKGRRQLAAIHEIEADFDNIRAAWLRSLQRQNDAAISDILESLFLFCEMRGRFQDGADLLAHAQRTFETDDALTLLWSGIFTRGLWLKLLHQGQSVEVNPSQIEMTLTVFRQHNDQNGVAFCLWLLGVYNYLALDNHAASIACLEQSLALFQQIGDVFYSARVADWLGAYYGAIADTHHFIKFSQQSLQLRRSSGDQFGIASSLMNLIDVALNSGYYAEAERYVHEQGAIYRELGSQRWIIRHSAHLATLAFQSGAFHEAQVLAEETLNLSKNIDPVGMVASGRAQIILGLLAALKEDYARTWQLCDFIAFPADKVQSNEGLAIAACGLGDFASARQHFLTSLQFNIRSHALKGLAFMLPVASVLLSRQGQNERAVELLGLAFHHPASAAVWLEKWPLLTRLRADLEAQLGVEIYAAAWERGKTLDLETTLAELLSEMGD
jgi:predicted ATPase/DNA-binding CsgD family transcriptional regulator